MCAWCDPICCDWRGAHLILELLHFTAESRINGDHFVQNLNATGAVSREEIQDKNCSQKLLLTLLSVLINSNKDDCSYGTS